MEEVADIKVTGLSVQYLNENNEEIDIIEDINFELYRRQIVSIVGPSGCGKTTILKALNGEITYSGECLVNTKRTSDLCYLNQEPSLLPWRSAIENAILGQEVREQKSININTAKDTLYNFGFKPKDLKKYPHQLSGGMKQRVAVARALESKAKILFCDEPFSANDQITRLKLINEFQNRLNNKISVLFVTHYIDEAIFLSDKILVMAGTPGRIVKTITPKFESLRLDPGKIRDNEEYHHYFKEIWSAMKI